jgi:hypothetical protein
MYSRDGSTDQYRPDFDSHYPQFSDMEGDDASVINGPLVRRSYEAEYLASQQMIPSQVLPRPVKCWQQPYKEMCPQQFNGPAVGMQQYLGKANAAPYITVSQPPPVKVLPPGAAEESFINCAFPSSSMLPIDERQLLLILIFVMIIIVCYLSREVSSLKWMITQMYMDRGGRVLPT